MIKKNNKMISLKRKKYDNKDNIYKIAKRVKTLERTREEKYTGVTYGATTIPTTGIVTNNIIAGIVQGNNQITYTGNEIQCKSLHYRIRFATTPDALLYEDIVSWYLVLDRQPNGALPAVSDYLSSGFYMSLPNNNFKKRFKTLRKGTCLLNTVAISSAKFYNNMHYIEDFIKFKKPIQITFKSNNGDITDISTNNFIFVFVSANGIANYQGIVRVRFQDA